MHCVSAVGVHCVVLGHVVQRLQAFRAGVRKKPCLQLQVHCLLLLSMRASEWNGL